MTIKVSQAQRGISKRKGRHARKVPNPGTEEHARWRENVREGVRKARLARRAAGLLTLREAALWTVLPLGAVKKEFPVFYAGGRPYVRERFVTEWLRETGGDVATEGARP
jgi:hypothetical protein